MHTEAGGGGRGCWKGYTEWIGGRTYACKKGWIGKCKRAGVVDAMKSHAMILRINDALILHITLLI